MQKSAPADDAVILDIVLDIVFRIVGKIRKSGIVYHDTYA